MSLKCGSRSTVQVMVMGMILREKKVLFCEGGLDWSAVRHPWVGGGGDVAAGQVPAPRLIPLHERRHRGLQVTNHQGQ
jgi:hypothetical protein